jgi:flagellar hook-associated protein 2
MPTVQFGGLISGLDTSAIVDSLVALERRSINVLSAQKATFQTQQVVISLLSSNLAALKTAAQDLADSTDFAKKSAASSDTSVLTASADTTAAPGTYDVSVTALAKAKSLESTSQTSQTAMIGTGTLTLTIGSVNTAITVDSSNNTLDGLRDAINNSAADVTASIVNVGASTADYRLIVQSNKTGLANEVTITSSLTGGNGNDPFSGGGTVVQAAADAQFTVNGLAVARSSNTVSDVITGVTFTLVKDAASATITVSDDTAAIKSTIEAFVTAYNDVIEVVNDQFSLDPNTQRQGPLAGDPALRGLQTRLRQEMFTPLQSNTTFSFLSDIGISFEQDGTLSIDDGKLTSALDSDPTEVKNLFLSTTGGVGKRIPDLVDAFVRAGDGVLSSREEGLSARIEGIDGKIAREEDRIAAFEKRLNDQFTALENLLSELNQQSSFLALQFSALNPVNTNRT